VWVIDTDNVKKTSTARIQPVKIALAEGQVTILDSGLEAGQNVVVDGADRLRPGQLVTVSAAHQRASGQTAGQGTANQAQAGSPFATSAQGANPSARLANGKGNGKSNEREQQ
jgi:hypothetical protein